MNIDRARELLAAERRRIEYALTQSAHPDDGEESDPFYNPANLAADLYRDELNEGLADDLRAEVAALQRAEQRLAAGTKGLSIESGRPTPDARREGRPTAALTIEEQRALTSPPGRHQRD